MLEETRPFNHLTILDLSDFTGAYCSKLFANLGAEVILLEPLKGFDLRRQSPFFQNQPGVERSLKYHYLSSDKKSVCCDITTDDGQRIVKKLFEKVDIVIEGFKPGYLKELGLSYDEVKKINPKIIWCAITPFGQDGPYSNYKSDDLIQMSLGGMTYLAGYPDTPPLLTYGEQSYYMASLFSAVSIMIAHRAKKVTNQGQYIDVSIQDCVAMGTETAPQFFQMKGLVRKRVGEVKEPATGVYPCKDGYVIFYTGGLGSIKGWLRLLNWLKEEEIEGVEQFELPKWSDSEWKKTEEAKREFYDIFIRFTKKYTKNELYEMGQKRKIAVSPVNTPQGVYENEQLNERGFFTTVSTIENEKVIGPGAPYRLSESEWKITNPAPLLGEHTKQVLETNGFSPDEIKAMVEKGVIR